MNTVNSFNVDHTKLKPGLYISNMDTNFVVYDLRMKVPNGGDYLEYAAIHTLEHLFASYFRGNMYGPAIVYVGPMGCRTGFYLILRKGCISHTKVITAVTDAMQYVVDFEGDIPGTSAKACGNYLEHDLDSAKREAANMLEVLSNWEMEQLNYVK